MRGWPTGLLGPKVPHIEFNGPEGDSLIAEQYIPLGGLAQLSALVGLQFPLPFLPSSWKALAALAGIPIEDVETNYFGNP